VIDLEQLQKVFQSTGEGMVRDIAGAQGLNCDFVVSVTPLNSEYSIVIEAGYPPVITIDSGAIMSALVNNDDKERGKSQRKLRRDIAFAVSKLPKMQRTLSIVPLAQAIALAKEAKRFVRTAFPEKVIYRIPDSHLDIQSTVTVTVREITTGQSVSLSGKNESVLRAQAVAQLTKLVAMNEYLQTQLEQESFVPEYKPSKIMISTDDRGTDVKYEY